MGSIESMERMIDKYSDKIEILENQNKQLREQVLHFRNIIPKPIRQYERKIKELETILFKQGAMFSAPCFKCGYNSEGYFDPEKHPCAIEHHKYIKEN